MAAPGAEWSVAAHVDMQPANDRTAEQGTLRSDADIWRP